MEQIKIRVTPRAKKTEITETLADGTLKIKLKSPPVDGKANEELIKFLEKINPNTLGLSVSINLHIYYLEKTIKKVREKFPEIPVLIGGQGLIGDGKEIMLRHHGVLYLKDLRAVESFLKQPLYDKAGTN